MMLQLAKNISEGLLQLIFPPICIGCEKNLCANSPVKNICSTCLSSLKAPDAKFIQHKILQRLRPAFLSEIQILGVFSPELQNIIHHIKYQRMTKTAVSFAENLQNRISFSMDEIDLIIPVPLHPAKLKERGYNQSLLLVQGLFQFHKNKIDADLILRRKSTKTQTKLNRDQRRKNVWDAFELSHPGRLKDKSVLLVDDVITTGATINECARICIEKECQKVFGLAIAAPTDLDID